MPPAKRPPGVDGSWFRPGLVAAVTAVVVLLLLSSGASLPALAAAQAQEAGQLFSDVPRSHWAYDAISRLAAEGLITGYDAGRFQGEQPVTRYEMAILVAKLLDRLPSLTLASTEKQLVARLSTEFSPEIRRIQEMLGVLETRTRGNETEIQRLSNEIAVFRDELDRVRAGEGAAALPSAVVDGEDKALLLARVEALEKRLAASQTSITGLTVAVGVLALAAGVAIFLVSRR